MKAPVPLRRLIARLELATSGYLGKQGWVETRATGRSMDSEGNPQPWFTYPALRFLDARVQPQWRVMEFGAGASTLWWSKRVAHVLAFEHHPGWAQRVSQESKAEVVAVPDTSAEAYLAASRGREGFDIVVVDGIFRPECILAAPAMLAADGVVIVDDAQREEYQPAMQALVAQGFRRLPFHGPQPVSKHAGCTEFLYRGANVLGI
jgi:precorrin-6B methylase 2